MHIFSIPYRIELLKMYDIMHTQTWAGDVAMALGPRQWYLRSSAFTWTGYDSMAMTLAVEETAYRLPSTTTHNRRPKKLRLLLCQPINEWRNGERGTVMWVCAHETGDIECQRKVANLITMQFHKWFMSFDYEYVNNATIAELIFSTRKKWLHFPS